MDVKLVLILVLNRLATTTRTKWASKQYETLNKDFLFPDQIPILRKEVDIRKKYFFIFCTCEPKVTC